MDWTIVLTTLITAVPTAISAAGAVILSNNKKTQDLVNSIKHLESKVDFGMTELKKEIKDLRDHDDLTNKRLYHLERSVMRLQGINPDEQVPP